MEALCVVQVSALEALSHERREGGNGGGGERGRGALHGCICSQLPYPPWLLHTSSRLSAIIAITI